MTTEPGWRSFFTSTSELVVGLSTWFIVAIAVSQFDPGPDWLERAGYPHIDAVVIGTFSAGLAVALTGFIRRRYRHRNDGSRNGEPAAISRVRPPRP